MTGRNQFSASAVNLIVHHYEHACDVTNASMMNWSLRRQSSTDDAEDNLMTIVLTGAFQLLIVTDGRGRRLGRQRVRFDRFVAFGSTLHRLSSHLGQAPRPCSVWLISVQWHCEELTNRLPASVAIEPSVRVLTVGLEALVAITDS